MRRTILILAAIAAVLWTGPIKADSGSGKPWSCSLDNIGATLTLCKRAPDTSTSGKRLYITDIVAQSTTSTAGLMLLEYGTGTNCGTGTAALFPSGASAARFVYAANSAAPTVLRFETPVAVPPGNDFCVLGTATNTVTIHVLGVIR